MAEIEDNLENINDIEDEEDSFEEDSEGSNRDDYKKIKQEVKGKSVKKKKNLGLVLGSLLKKKTKADKTILVGNKNAFKKVDEEKQKLIEMQEHKKTRLAQKKLGFKTIEEWDKAHEKKLSKITTKGVVKLFNSIYEFRKKIRDEKVKEDTHKERKSTNFLMMHNLDPTVTQSKLKKGNNKSYEEDN